MGVFNRGYGPAGFAAFAAAMAMGSMPAQIVDDRPKPKRPDTPEEVKRKAKRRAQRQARKRSRKSRK